MPRIPTQQQREILPSGQVPSVPMPENLFTAEIRAGDLSGSFQEAINVFRKLDNIEVNTQVSQAEGFINEKRTEMRQFATDNLDHTLYQAKWKELQAEIASVAGQVKNPRARRNVQNYITRNKALWQDTVNGFENRGRITSGIIELDNAIDRIVLGDFSQEAVMFNMTEEEAKASALENQLEAAVGNGLISEALADKKRLAAEVGIQKFKEEKIKRAKEIQIDAIVENALSFTVKEGPAEGLPDTKAGLKLIRESDLSPSNRVKANTIYNALVKQQRDALDVQRETHRDELNKALSDGTINYDMINDTSLPEDEQLAYQKLLANLAKDKDEVVTDEQVRSGLRARAYDIGRGTITKTQFYALLNPARYGDDPTIDDAAYKELAALAETEVTKSQADFMAEIHTDAREQLVDLTSETRLALIIAGRMTELRAERHQVQLWWADRYENEMELLIQEHPEKSKRENYQEAQMALATYINTPYEEIKALRARRLVSLVEQQSRRRQATPITKPLIEGEIFPTPAKEPLIEGELDIEGVLKTPKRIMIPMQSPSGGRVVMNLAGIGKKLDQGFVFPSGSNVRVKRNPSDKTVSFEGLSIEPGKRVISFDGGATWQLLP